MYYGLGWSSVTITYFGTTIQFLVGLLPYKKSIFNNEENYLPIIFFIYNLYLSILIDKFNLTQFKNNECTAFLGT